MAHCYGFRRPMLRWPPSFGESEIPNSLPGGVPIDGVSRAVLGRSFAKQAENAGECGHFVGAVWLFKGEAGAGNCARRFGMSDLEFPIGLSADPSDLTVSMKDDNQKFNNRNA